MKHPQRRQPRQCAAGPLDYRAQDTAFEVCGVFFSTRSVNLTGSGEPERLTASGVTKLLPGAGREACHGAHLPTGK